MNSQLEVTVDTTDSLVLGVKERNKGKACTRCFLWRPLSMYSPHNRTTDGYANVCSTCRREKAAAKAVKDYGKVGASPTAVARAEQALESYFTPYTPEPIPPTVLAEPKQPSNLFTLLELVCNELDSNGRRKLVRMLEAYDEVDNG